MRSLPARLVVCLALSVGCSSGQGAGDDVRHPGDVSLDLPGDAADVPPADLVAPDAATDATDPGPDVPDGDPDPGDLPVDATPGEDSADAGPDLADPGPDLPAGCGTDDDCEAELAGHGDCERAACLPSGECALQPAGPDSPCDDGDPCTVSDTCDGAGTCVGSDATAVPVASGGCDDSDACTLDTCEAGQCAHGSLAVDCVLSDWSDWGACTGAPDGCTGEWTRTRTVVVESSCGGAACGDLEEADACSLPPALPCDDGDPCTVSDTCDGAGACVGSDATAVPVASGGCDDTDACTLDTCEAGQCAHESLAVDCVVSDWSDWGACTGAPDECTGEWTRTRTVVVEASCGGAACGELEEADACPLPPALPCDDGDACTFDDACDGGGNCLGTDATTVPVAGGGCDDGDPCTADTCEAGWCVSAFSADLCPQPSGESCAEVIDERWATVERTDGLWTHRWTLPADSVAVADGTFACDPNTHGPDAVIEYRKDSDTVANGGGLLRVRADTPATTTTTNYLNVEVTADGCDPATARSLKCLWYKDNWDAYLDVPPGTYHVWVQKNSPATASVPFPEVTVEIAEVDPWDAEGEGCFAPYTTGSAIYTPPATDGDAHTWTIPATINSFDMGPTWGEPWSISCDDTAPYGDIHGVDAVIEYVKQAPDTVLRVEVQNLDPVAATQSDLDVEVLQACDPADPQRLSLACGANRDAFDLTAAVPAGPVYLWVSTEATGEEFNGAMVQVSELTLGAGESWATAEAIAGSTAITPTSAERWDAPSCFPGTGAVHWYRYTLSSDVLSVAADVAGALGVLGAGGQEVACTTDATSPIGLLAAPGDTFYLAVESPGTIRALVVRDFPYTGVRGPGEDLGLVFPGTIAPFGMALSSTELFLGTSSAVFSAPKTPGATATQHGSAEGITSTHLGYDIAFADGKLFGVDSTTATTASRVFRLYDGTTWGPGTAWDLNPNYPSAGGTYAMAADGSTLYLVTRNVTATAAFFALSAAGLGVPTLLGTNADLWYAVGLAVDPDWFYVASKGPAGEGVYRVPRADPSGTPQRILALDTGTTHNTVVVSGEATPRYLYARAVGGDVYAVADPGSPDPLPVGVVSTLGDTSDYAMALDPSDGSLYLFEGETKAAGAVRRLH